MLRKAFDLLEQVEQSWLYRGRTELIHALVSRFTSRNTGLELLDFGAGFGGFYHSLSPFGEVDAVEPYKEGYEGCCKRGYRSRFKTLEEMGQEKKYDVIIACEVIEHIEDHRAILAQLKTKLREDGILILTVPAFNFLWTKRDDEHGHYRRYTSRTIGGVMRSSGFSDLFVSYWNCFLFPIAASMRLIGLSGDSGLDVSPPLERVLLQLLRIETFLLSMVKLPFGLTLVVVGRP